MICREEKLRNELDQGAEFVLLEGRDIIHSCSCNYIRESERKKIRVRSMDQMAEKHLCKRCCVNYIPNPYSVVIDLEMCRVQKKCDYAYSHEIIQIGAVVINETFEIVSEFSTYVRPEYGLLDPYITRLTGIVEGNIASAPILKDAMEMFLDWMEHFKIEKIYAWSRSDYIQLDYELRFKKLQSGRAEDLLDPDFWIDYQEVFDSRYRFGRAVSLKDALRYSEICPVGRAHNGLDDAVNTAMLIEKLEKNPDYKPCVCGTEEPEGERLTFTIGNILSHLFAQTENQMEGCLAG